MTPEEYLSPILFPLSTVPGLALREQIERDIRVYEDYLLAEHYGTPMTDHGRAVGREVAAKRRGLRDVLQDDAARPAAAPGSGEDTTEPTIVPAD
jgi:hypothetical protein